MPAPINSNRVIFGQSVIVVIIKPCYYYALISTATRISTRYRKIIASYRAPTFITDIPPNITRFCRKRYLHHCYHIIISLFRTIESSGWYVRTTTSIYTWMKNTHPIQQGRQRCYADYPYNTKHQPLRFLFHNHLTLTNMYA